MIKDLSAEGVFIEECTLAGETRADGVFPGHANGIPVARDRWLIVYATRGFRVMDDDRSIVYQLRRGSPTGPVLKEGFLAQSGNSVCPGVGIQCFKQHGHPVAFGVPKGAIIKGKPAPHANCFAVKWRVLAMPIVRDGRGRDTVIQPSSGLTEMTQGVEWIQIRLNDSDDDIEIVQPAGPMRQKGYEDGPLFCSLTPPAPMNQSFVQPVPFNDACDEWADCNHFSGRIAALRYKFNKELGRYEWVETGAPWEDPSTPLSEASLAHVGLGGQGGDWVMAARVHAGARGRVAWARVSDPFRKPPLPTYTGQSRYGTPICVYTCADGVLRLVTNDESISPYRDHIRNPLYCWDVNPDGFSMSAPRVVFEAAQAGLPLRPEGQFMVDFGHILPSHEREQYLVHRVLVRAVDVRTPWWDAIATQAEKDRCGLHCVRLTYDEVAPAPWSFA